MQQQVRLILFKKLIRYLNLLVGLTIYIPANAVLPNMLIRNTCDTSNFQKVIQIPIQNLGLFDKAIQLLEVKCSFDWAAPYYPQYLYYETTDTIELRLANTIDFYQMLKRGAIIITTLEYEKKRTYQIELLIKPIPASTQLIYQITTPKVAYLRNVKTLKDTFEVGNPIVVDAIGKAYCNNGKFGCKPRSRLQIQHQDSTNSYFIDIYEYHSQNEYFYSVFWSIPKDSAIRFSLNEFDRSKTSYGEELEDIRFTAPFIEMLIEKNIVTVNQYATFRYLILGIDDEWYATNPFTIKITH